MNLVNGEWQIAPNLHIRHIQKPPTLETETTLNCTDYWNYFFENQCQIGQHDAPGFQEIVEQWQRIQLLNRGDMERVNEEVNQEHNQMRISPGYSLSRDWNLDTIIAWENEGVLVSNLIEAINEVLQVWDEPIE